jgi:putative ABC transport system permease protein
MLTVLGLVFGVASVIIMLSIAQGASAEAQRQIESLGVLNIIVLSQKPLLEEKREDSSWFVEYGLTYSDLRRIQTTVKTIRYLSPQREFIQKVRRLERTMDVPFIGVKANFDQLNSLDVGAGRFLELNDTKTQQNVCVIGADVQTELFRNKSAVGQTIRVGEFQQFRVVGVTRWRTPSAGVGSSLSSQDFNKHVYIPLTTDRARFGQYLVRRQQGQVIAEKLALSQITVQVENKDVVTSTARALESLLAAVHPKKDFSVVVPLDLLEQSKRTQKIFSYVLGSVAAISLLVGGIGIMNIMLATVSERQQEIGIRRALGATRKDIVLQFLIETLVLSLIGAFIGVTLGIVVPTWVSHFSDVPTQTTLWGPMIATIVAIGTGVGFGLYPALAAARMDPIEALRRV